MLNKEETLRISGCGPHNKKNEKKCIHIKVNRTFFVGLLLNSGIRQKEKVQLYGGSYRNLFVVTTNIQGSVRRILITLSDGGSKWGLEL